MKEKPERIRHLEGLCTVQLDKLREGTMESNSQYQQCANPRETNSFEQYPADAGTCTVQNGLPADGLKNIFCKNVVHIIFSPM